MRALLLSKKLSRALSSNSPSFKTLTASISSSSSSSTLSGLLSSLNSHPAAVNRRNNLLGSLWSVIQHRDFKVHGSDVKVGNIIQRKERIYQVTRVDHSHEGRGKATIKVELRDVEGGTKVTQRLGTDESVDSYAAFFLKILSWIR